MTFRPRFDERTGVYRDCRWCAGNGCLQCEAERDAEYARQFPNGPQPIATARLDDPASIEAFKQALIDAGMHPISKQPGDVE